MPFVSTAATVAALRRICPRCHRVQIVAPSKKAVAVRCKLCKAEIPPRRPRGPAQTPARRR